jgi:hypothetical protein
MTRTLSWAGTFPSTRLFPAVWISGFGWGVLSLFASPRTTLWNGVRGGAPPGARWLLLTIWVGASALLVLMGWGLKRVRLGENELFVSNYLREIAIPLNAIRDVRQRLFPHFGAVTIELRHATPFGQRITFIPKGRGPRWLGQEGEVFLELRALVARTTDQALAG